MSVLFAWIQRCNMHSIMKEQQKMQDWQLEWQGKSRVVLDSDMSILCTPWNMQLNKWLWRTYLVRWVWHASLADIYSYRSDSLGKIAAIISDLLEASVTDWRFQCESECIGPSYLQFLIVRAAAYCWWSHLKLWGNVVRTLHEFIKNLRVTGCWEILIMIKIKHKCHYDSYKKKES